MRRPSGVLAGCALALIVVTAGVSPATAKIVKTRRVGQPSPGLGFTLGTGFEYQNDGEQTEYGVPMLLEWALTSRISLTAEPAFISIHSTNGASISGWDDLETNLRVELVPERRYRPGFALEGGIKFPTATQSEIGTGLTDYALGAIATKEFVQAELGLNVVYSHVGLPAEGRVQNTVQLSMATEWHLTPTLDLTGELLTTQGIGALRGRAGRALPGGGGINVPGRGAGEVESTLGFAHHFGKRLKLEEGVVVQTDGTWQAVFAWEWDFGEGR